MTKLRRGAILAVVSAVTLAAASASGQTRSWVHNAQAGFDTGEKKSVVVTSQGDLRLARGLKTIVADDGGTAIITSLVEAADGTLVIGTAVPARVITLTPGATAPVVLADLPDETMVTTVLVDQAGRIVVGTSGETAKVLRYPPAGGEPESLLDDKDTQHVWDIVAGPKGELFIATGPEGKLFVLKPDAELAELAFDFEEDNLLSLAADATGRLFVGTDPRGLVYRFDVAGQGKPVVLFDAAEPEIAALAIDADGNLLVAAGAPSEGGEGMGNGSRLGVPDGEGKGAHPKPAPGFPEEPAPPAPNPGPPIPGQPPEPEPKTDEPNQRAPQPGASLDISSFLAEGPNGFPGAVIRLPIPDKSTTPPSPNTEGSALYRIDREGFVGELYRGAPSIFSMVEKDGVVLLGTDNDAAIIEVDTRRDEVSEIARGDGSEVTALLRRKDGTVVVGVSHGGSVSALSPGVAAEGAFTSEVLDAAHTARFGVVRLDGTLPEGSSVTLSARSGNTEEPTESGWTAWSDPLPAGRFVKPVLPPGRFFQYRLTLKPGAKGESPVAREVEVAYRVPNMAPRIGSVEVAVSGGERSAESGTHSAIALPTHAIGGTSLSWEADDSNGDTLEYSLDYRPVGETDWRPLRGKLTETAFDWDAREVPDGRYQVRVVADDAPSNVPGEQRRTSRLSAVFIIDHTAPRFTKPVATAAVGEVTIKGQVRDATGVIKSVGYRIGSEQQWRNAAAGDKLFDSPSEDFTVVLRDLAPGRHVIRLRVTDGSGNEGFETVVVEVPAAK